jgi:hypothetical protein
MKQPTGEEKPLDAIAVSKKLCPCLFTSDRMDWRGDFMYGYSGVAVTPIYKDAYEAGRRHKQKEIASGGNA